MVLRSGLGCGKGNLFDATVLKIHGECDYYALDDEWPRYRPIFLAAAG